MAAKKEENSALQEMVEKLQEEKVSFATELESSRKKLQSLHDLERRFEDVETEKLGQERQLRRQNEENEDLLRQVDELDKQARQVVLNLLDRRNSTQNLYQQVKTYIRG